MDRSTIPAWEQHSLGPGRTQVILNWAPDGDAWQRTADWFLAHGVDPKYVPVPGWLEINQVERQVRYLHWISNESGVHLLADDQGNPVAYGDERNHVITGEAATEVAVVQLESAPLPWPEPAPAYDARTLEDL